MDREALMSESKLSATALISQVFFGLAPEDLDALRAVAKTRTYQPGDILCHEGESEHIFYIISEGAATAYHTLPGGEERVLEIKRPGQFFGEMALIDNQPRVASVRAASPLTVIEVTEDVFDAVVARSPAAAMAIMRQVVRSLRNNDERAIGDLIEKNEQLARAYQELQEAQAQLVEQAVVRHELEVAAEVQQGLLPREIPKFHGYTFAGINTPARHIGGDLYDVLLVDETHAGLLMADVSDKSVHAALYMAITKTLFQTLAKHVLSPAEVAYRVHEGLLEASSTDEMFVTAFYGVLDCHTGLLRYVRAGQERPLLLRGDGSPVEALPGDGRFLGQLEGLHLDECEVILRPGDLLMLFSDGVPDAVNPAGERFDSARLRALLAMQRGKHPRRAVEALVESVIAFQGSAPQFDDMTLLVVAAPQPGEED
jgi:sigma-B regulation protein RsbU (phosphoserine phosphatase)